MSIFVLDRQTHIFPHPYLADKDGFLAIGGDLSPERLLGAYSAGIFPWYSEDTPILWFSTHPRLVLYPDKLNVSKSMRQLLNRNAFEITIDTCFQNVIEACAKQKRDNQSGTWITSDLKQSFLKLHELGYAHSVEVWEDNVLVGGLYGLSMGKVFYGESMFASKSNASKYGFISLVRLLREKSFTLIDCQQDTPHLRSFGAELITKKSFLTSLKKNIFHKSHIGKWTDWV